MLYSMCAWTDSAGLGSPISPDGPSHLEDLRKQHKAWVPPSAAGRKTYVRMDPVGVWISTDSESLIIIPFSDTDMESSPEEDSNARRIRSRLSEISRSRLFAISRNCSMASPSS